MTILPEKPSIDLLKVFISESDLEFATICFVDYQGTVRGKYVSRTKLESAFDSVSFPMVSLALDPDDTILFAPHISDPESGIPDRPAILLAETARLIPWAPERRNLLLFAEFVGEDAELCPRNVLKSVLSRADRLGFRAAFSTELEFTVFNETPHSLIQKGHRGLQLATPLKTYYSLVRQEAQSEFYNDLMDMCSSMRIPLESIHQEMGAGFMEVALRFGYDTSVADASALFKSFSKVVAQRHGKIATFMARWSEGADGQSGHIHMSLQRSDGSSAFFDEDYTYNMSAVMRHFIGGLQALMGEFLLMFAPNVNSYKRFVPGIFAPTSAAWGVENRTCGIRAIPGSPKSIRLECRTPGADANPYLSIAAVLMAGLHGVENALEPTGAYDGNVYAEDIPANLKLPNSFQEAIIRFRNSDLAREYFGNRFVDAYAGTRQAQLDQFSAMITDRELERFFELV